MIKVKKIKKTKVHRKDIKKNKFKVGFSYYGGKGKLSSQYPKPKYDRIVEPFAGGAAYSFLHYKHDVVLYEIDPEVVEMLKFLRDGDINIINRIPDKVKKGDNVYDIMDKMNCEIPIALKNILISSTNLGTFGTKNHPKMITQFAAGDWERNTKRKLLYWNCRIKHWKIRNNPYEQMKMYKSNSTFFIDPPYSNKAGKLYKYSNIDYDHLKEWISKLKGQIIICENKGSTWIDGRVIKKNTGFSNTNAGKEVKGLRNNSKNNFSSVRRLQIPSNDRC